MTNDIECFLAKHGPCLTNVITAYLVANLSLSPATARQRVSRMPSTVKRLAYFPFPRNVRFAYLEQDYGSKRFWDRLVDAFETTNSIYGAALSAVRARDGIVPEVYFNTICGAPVRQQKHVSAEIVLSRLLEGKLLERRIVEGIGPCIILPNNEAYMAHSIEEARARLLTEGTLLSAIAAWARNNGIVSYGKVRIRNLQGAPDVGTTVWDLTGPCYLHSVAPNTARSEGGRPAFLVVDVLLKSVDVADVRAFVRKCEAVRRLPRVTCIQMFVASKLSAAARDLLKKHGIIASTVNSLFGKDFQSGLNDLRDFYRGIISNTTFDTEKLDDLLRRFGEIEGASLQIRGTLFEFLAARIARHKYGTDVIHMNRVYHGSKVPNSKAEADLTIEQGDTALTFIECKGTAPYGVVPDEQFYKWLNVQVPTIYSATRVRPEWANRKINFEFWATAPLTSGAAAAFEEAKMKLKSDRYGISLRLNDEITKFADDTGELSLKIAFNKYFKDRGTPNQGVFA